MSIAKKLTIFIAGGVALIYIGDVIGYNLALSENNKTKLELTKAQTAASDTSKEYDKLLTSHNDLIAKWNEQQKDITAGKYTRTQYVNVPSYVPTYSPPIRCSTQYYTYFNSSSTTCY